MNLYSLKIKFRKIMEIMCFSHYIWNGEEEKPKQDMLFQSVE